MSGAKTHIVQAWQNQSKCDQRLLYVHGRTVSISIDYKFPQKTRELNTHDLYAQATKVDGPIVHV